MRCALLQLVLLAGVIGTAGCRGDDGGEGEAEAEAESESEAESEAEGEDVSIYAIQRGEIAVGTEVVLLDVVVTAVDAYDNPGTDSEDVGSLYVQEPEPDPTDGRRYSGIYVFAPARKDWENGGITDLVPGDLVTVRGTVDEYAWNDNVSFCTSSGLDETYCRMTEITQGTVELLGTTDAIEPEDVDLADFAAGETSEPWEGVLIRVANVVATCGPDAYGTFPAEGDGGWVDVSFDMTADPGVAFDDCFASIAGPLNYFFGYRIQPRGSEDLLAGPGCVLEVTPVAQIQGGDFPTDSTVRVRGVITAVDANPVDDWGFFVQEGTGAQSGIYVYGDEGDAVLGDEVVVRGTYTEYYELSEISFASTCRIGPGTMPAPEVLDPTTAASEDWEGVLVRVADVTVTNANPDAATDCSGTPCDFGEFEVGGALRVDDELYDYDDASRALDTVYSSITGPIHYSFGNFKLLPRDASDLVE